MNTENEKHELGTPPSNLPEIDFATLSQYNYTLFADGHWEERITNTDGTLYSFRQGSIGRKPHKGDLKHVDAIWNGRGWTERNRTYYN